MHRAQQLRRRQRRQDQRQHRQRRRQRRRACRQTWLDCTRQFFTSHFWRVAHQGAGPYQAVRWHLQPLLLVCFLTLFCQARAAQDRFEEARATFVALYPHRQRPGRQFAGYLDALARLPRYFFKRVQPVLRQRVAHILQSNWYVDGWIPFAVDGSRLALPRCAQLEHHFGTAGTGDFPHLWITSLLHVPTGVPWSWRFGRSDASERHHLQALVPTLPARALVLADAGFVGYDVWASLIQQQRHFLIRVGANVQLYADYRVEAAFTEGVVYLWSVTKPEQPPLRLRLLRLPPTDTAKHDVWLVTNAAAEDLSRDTASKLYRQRWQHEVFYRSYKCTLRQTKLASRTTQQVVREAELALLGAQVLLAQAAWAVSRVEPQRQASCAKAVRQVQREWRYLRRRGRLQQGYLVRLGQAQREHRPQRRSRKNYREWPRKRPHKVPGRPRIAAYSEELKARLQEEVTAP
jgi:hypothetical protein